MSERYAVLGIGFRYHGVSKRVVSGFPAAGARRASTESCAPTCLAAGIVERLDGDFTAAGGLADCRQHLAQRGTGNLPAG